MKTKQIIAFLLAAIMAATCAACGAETGSTAQPSAGAEAAGFTPALDTDAELTINVVGGWGNFEALDEVAINFQEYYPGIEVVYTQIKNGAEDVKNMVASGSAPDIFCLTWYNPDQTDKTIYTDIAEDLTEAGIDLSNLNSDMLVTGQVDGEQLLVPVYEQVYGMIVNYNLLEENGVSVPRTYSELLNACEKLTEAGYEHPIFLGGSASMRSIINMVMSDILNSDDPEATAKAMAAGEDSNGYLEAALSRYDELDAMGYFDHEAESFDDTYESVILRFFEGDIPFVLYSSSQYSGTKKREAKSEHFTSDPFNYGMEPSPLEDDNAAAYITTLGCLYMGAYKGSENLEYVNEFLRFALSDEQMTVLADVKNMGVTTENTGLARLAGLEGMTEEQKIYPTQIDGYYAIDQALGDAVSSYVPGVTPHEEVLEIFTAGGK